MNARFGNENQAEFFSGLLVGIQTFGVAAVSHLAVNQLGRTAVRNGTRRVSLWATKGMGPRAARWLSRIAGKEGAKGASARSAAAKFIEGNLFAAVVVTTVVSGGEFWRLAKGEQSAAQTGKGVGTNAAGVAGGIGGAVVGAKGGTVAGAIIGTLIGGFPVGTAAGEIIGGFIGGLGGGVAGGAVATTGTRKVLDKFVEDDAIAMYRICSVARDQLIEEYSVQESEVCAFNSALREIDWQALYRRIYACRVPLREGTEPLTPEDLALPGEDATTARLQHARGRFRPVFEMVISATRPPVHEPVEGELLETSAEVLERQFALATICAILRRRAALPFEPELLEP